MDNCVFCKIIRKEITSYRIWEDENFLAILDIFPISKGMTLVISKQHKTSYIPELDTDTWQKLHGTISDVSKILDTKLTGNLKTTFLFEGLDIPHLHAKLIPIYREDLDKQPHPDKATEQSLQEVCDLLKA